MISDEYMSTGSGGTRKPYPEGRKREMTPEWKQSVKDKLTLLGRNQTWLAEQVGVDKSTISLMLRADQVTSSVVDDVSKVLEIPLPTVGIDEIDSETLDDLKQLEPEDKEQVRALIAMLRKLRDQAKKP